MASNYTENFSLCQWAAEDPVLREDFNADNQKLEAALTAMPRMAVGNYGGSGECGSEAPNTLTFDFQPMLVVITADAGATLKNGTVLVRGQSSSSGLGLPDDSTRCLDLHVTWSGNSVSWYTDDVGATANRQLNASGRTYCYFAIGG